MDPRVRLLFKQLLYMGKEYPAESGGYAKFAERLKAAFRNTNADTAQSMDKALEKGQHVTKGMFRPFGLSVSNTNSRVGSSLLPTSVQAPQKKLLQLTSSTIIRYVLL